MLQGAAFVHVPSLYVQMTLMSWKPCVKEKGVTWPILLGGSWTMGDWFQAMSRSVKSLFTQVKMAPREVVGEEKQIAGTSLIIENFD